MELKELITNYLSTKHVMQLATVRDGQPWCCNVHFLADENANLYWLSTQERRHSQEIRDDPRVAVAIAVQTDEEKPGAPVVGIQVEGDAELINDPDEIKRIMRKYTDHHGRDETFFQDITSGNNPHKLYRLKPRLYVLFDKKEFPDDPRREWKPNA
jgi:uncharacterized protein YhbP (UPF0306 family)